MIASTNPQLEEFFRLPAKGQRIYGLTRSTINELVLPTEANNHRPPVKSLVIKKRHAIRGIRLIHRESFLAYLAAQLEGNQ
jgi:hypothetical protein